jgi:hypothetical protein
MTLSDMQIPEINAPRKDGIGTSMTAPSIFSSTD